MKKFQVGCKYEPYATEFEPIEVVRRTEKTIWVKNEKSVEWRMRIKTDENGDEYAIDSTVPGRWREAFTYKAEYKVVR